MMRSWSWLLISVALSAQAEPPRRIEIAFTMSRNGSAMAEVVERLEYLQGNYKLTETWKGKGIYALLGSARRVSQGSLAEGSLRPREFFDERSGRDTARAWFDWNAKTLTMQYKSNKASEPLPPNAQDRLSFLFALSLVPGKADSVSYTIADGKGLSRHVYRVVGRERIRTPLGEFDTVKMARQGDERETAELWLAAERAFIPVRLLVVEKDGTRYEQLATRISQ
ncbi:MAG TPA: DUF3108 domain-containing protein [Burkholderiales bacterium]|nr:DUF3108 domain-containing protein [Burkholderiales bacterium]